MAGRQYINTAYSLGQSGLSTLAQLPVVAKRAPLTTDFAQIGTVWIYTTTNAAYILTSIVNNSATWLLVESSGGAGVFSSLTVTPGPTSITGTTDIEGTTTINTTSTAATSIGNTTGTLALLAGTFTLNGVAATSYTIGAATTTGAITIGGTAQSTGVITLGSSSATSTVAIAAGAGASTVNIGNGVGGNTIAIGNGANTSAQTVSIASGASAGNSTVTILGGNVASGSSVLNIATGSGGKTVNLASGAGNNQVTIGSTNTTSFTQINAGSAGINLNAAFTSLPGPVYIYTGAGVPSNGLALHVGDIYINTTAASATTRMYIATAASTWTNVTCAG